MSCAACVVRRAPRKDASLSPEGVGQRPVIQEQRKERLYEATVPATEEAVVNALVANEGMVGIHGHRTPALPRDRVVDLLRARGVTIEPCSDRT
jgi:D-aminopeptidase